MLWKYLNESVRLQSTTRINRPTTGFFLGVAVSFLFSAGATADNWTSWGTHSEWRGLDVRIRCQDGRSSDGETMVTVQFRNRYQERINFSTITVVRGITPRDTSDRLNIRAGDTGETWYNLSTRACPGNTSTYVNQVRFGRDDGPYATPR